MTFAFFLKILGEMSYYTAISAFIAASFGLKAGDPLPAFLLPLLFLAAVGAAAALIARSRKPSLKYLPFLLLPLLYFLLPQPLALILFLPPVGYTVYLTVTGYEPAHSSAAQIFRKLCVILPLPALFVILLNGAERLTAYSMPYLLLFFLAEVQLLRTLRHDEKIISSLRYQILNGTLLLVMVGIVAFLSSPPALAGAKAVLGFFYRNLLVPIYMLIMLVFLGIAWLIMKLATWLLPSVEMEKPMEELKQEFKITDFVPEETEAAGVPAWVTVAFRILGALIIAFIIFLVLRRFFRLLTAGGKADTSLAGSSVRSKLSDRTSAAAPLRRFSASTPEEKVRYYYQELIRLSVKVGGIYSRCLTSEDIESMALRLIPEASAEIRALQQLYRPARYGGEITAEAANEAKALYKEIKRISIARTEPLRRTD